MNKEQIVKLVKSITGYGTIKPENAQPPAECNQIETALVLGFIQQESDFRPEVWRNDRNGGSYGLMQLDLQTAYDVGFPTNKSGKDLYDPETNIKYALAYLAAIKRYLKAHNAYTEENHIAAYNIGMGAVVRHVNAKIPGQLDAYYVRKVTEYRDHWRAVLATEGTLIGKPPSSKP